MCPTNCGTQRNLSQPPTLKFLFFCTLFPRIRNFFSASYYPRISNYLHCSPLHHPTPHLRLSNGIALRESRAYRYFYYNRYVMVPEALTLVSTWKCFTRQLFYISMSDQYLQFFLHAYSFIRSYFTWLGDSITRSSVFDVLSHKAVSCDVIYLVLELPEYPGILL